MYKWFLKKMAGWVARYPRAAFGLVVGYIVLSFFEIIPVIEIVTDFVVVLAYGLIQLYIFKKRKEGQPL